MSLAVCHWAHWTEQCVVSLSECLTLLLPWLVQLHLPNECPMTIEMSVRMMQSTVGKSTHFKLASNLYSIVVLIGCTHAIAIASADFDGSRQGSKCNKNDALYWLFAHKKNSPNKRANMELSWQINWMCAEWCLSILVPTFFLFSPDCLILFACMCTVFLWFRHLFIHCHHSMSLPFQLPTQPVRFICVEEWQISFPAPISLCHFHFTKH